MKSKTVYQIESDDPTGLTPRTAGEIESWFVEEILDSERGSKNEKASPGMIALRAIKNNEFTAAQVQAFVEYSETLFDRRKIRIANLRKERDEFPSDSTSLSTYDFLIESMEGGLEIAQANVSKFDSEFQENTTWENFDNACSLP